MMADRIALAFSGGLDTSWCVPWLRERTGKAIVTVTVDVGGFGPDEREALLHRSRLLGAERHIHVDARQTFFDEVLRPLIFGNVLRGQLYPLCVGAERGLQAREVARVAHEIGAGAVAHGCTAAGNDQVRFEVALRALAADLEILAPIRDLAPSRGEEIEYLEKKGVPVPPLGGIYSINAGLWGVTIGGGPTTGTEASLPEEAWVRTLGAFDDPLEPSSHEIAFERGIPVALDGKRLDPVPLIESLDLLAASYGIGRGIHLGDTILGTKGRVAFEAPAATVLITAHRELEKLVLSAKQQRVKEQVAVIYGDIVHEGQGLDGAARDIEALFESSQRWVTGEVRVAMRPGSVFVEGVTSSYSLHAASRSVYGEAVGEWEPRDAAGFSRLLGLPSVLQTRARREEGGA